MILWTFLVQAFLWKRLLCSLYIPVLLFITTQYTKPGQIIWHIYLTLGCNAKESYKYNSYI